MKTEQIITQTTGDKIKIISTFRESNYGDVEPYHIEIMKCLKGKRTFFNPIDTDSYTFRRY